MLNLPIQYIDGHKILPTQITCKDLGMTTNDDDKNNAELLVNGILHYGTVVVDGQYDININANTLTSASKFIQNRIELIGSTQDAALNFKNGSTNTYLFHFGQTKQNQELESIVLKNIKFNYDDSAGRNSSDAGVDPIDELTVERFTKMDRIMQAKENNDEWLSHIQAALLDENAKSLVQIYEKEFQEAYKIAYTKLERNESVNMSEWTWKEMMEDLWASYETDIKFVCTVFLQAYNKLKSSYQKDTARLTLFFLNQATDGNDFSLKLNNILIENCSFIGCLRVIDFGRDKKHLPINFINCDIKHNYFQNARTGSFSFGNCQYETINVSNNTINNFDNAFLNANVGDITKGEGDTISGQTVALNCKNIIMENNVFTCDDNWYHNPYSTTSYYSTCVLESLKVTYRNNRAVGMKSHRPQRLKISSHGDKLVRGGFGLYQAYLSCRDVLVENNHWENNLEFFDYENNTLLKAKDNQLNPGISVTAGTIQTKVPDDEVGIRRYIGNTFISTEEFLYDHMYKHWAHADPNYLKQYCSWMNVDNKYNITNMPATADSNEWIIRNILMPKCQVSLISNVSVNDWEIKNNKFHIFNLRGGSGTGASDHNSLTMSGALYFGSKQFGWRTSSIPETEDGANDEDISSDDDYMPGSKWTVTYNDDASTVKEGCAIYYYITTDSNLEGVVSADGNLLNNVLPIKDSNKIDSGDSISVDAGYYIYFYMYNSTDQRLENITDVTITVKSEKGEYFKLGYYQRNLIVENNIFHIGNISKGLFGTQRTDSLFRFVGNTLIIQNPRKDKTITNQPRLYTGKMSRTYVANSDSWDYSLEPVGNIIIKDNYISGLGPLLVSPNITDLEISNNHFDNVGALIYYTADDIAAIQKQYLQPVGATPRIMPVTYLHGANNTASTPITTFLATNHLFEITYSPVASDDTIVLAQRVNIKEIGKQPDIGIACTGVSLVKIDGNNNTPSFFAGTKIFAENESFYSQSEYVDKILQEDNLNIVLSKYSTEPDHPDIKQWIKYTLFNYNKEV